MKVTIEPQTRGWVVVGTEAIVVNIHKDCSGLAGELRDAALRVYELLGAMKPDEEEDRRGQSA